MVKKLTAPSGTTEASVGTNLYPVDLDGTVLVPDTDAPALLEDGSGFVEADPVISADGGFVRMIATNGVAAVACLGHQFEAGSDGIFVVPAKAAAELTSHGLIAAEALPA